MTDLFPAAVYILCFATSTACAGLLARSYRRTGARLLLWSALAFLLLAINNGVLVVDLLLVPEVSLQIPRLLLSLAALAVLLFGFVWDVEARDG
jgi:hypothetical protein